MVTLLQIWCLGYGCHGSCITGGGGGGGGVVYIQSSLSFQLKLPFELISCNMCAEKLLVAMVTSYLVQNLLIFCISMTSVLHNT